MKTKLSERPRSRGFALVATLMLMILLSLLAVGMLSLSAVSLRSSGYAAPQTEARANARMALMLAIGELQTYSGADTRVTAPANIVDSSYPPVLGVWRSWEGTNHDTNGRPIAPAYGSKNQAESSGGRFLNWLVSTAASSGAPDIADPPSLVLTSATNDTVPLLAGGSLQSTDPSQVHVVPTEAINGGRFAWWVSGENQKARLAQPYYPRADDAAGWSELAKSHSTPDPAQFGLDTLLVDPEAYHPDPTSSAKPVSKALSLQTTSLLVAGNPSEPQFGFHDLSTSAVGLLTNTATGGWRKDLTILAEKWDEIYGAYPGGELPLFRYSPNIGATSAVPKPTVAYYDPDQVGIYPWSGFLQIGGVKYPHTYHTAASSWQSLVNYLTFYKKMTYDSSTGIPQGPFGWQSYIRSWRGGTVPNQMFYNHYHDEELSPILARVQLIVQAQALLDPDPARADPSLYYRINLRTVPIITIWNPYNVEIKKELVGAEYNPSRDNDFGIGTEKSLPVALSIINGSSPPTTGFAGLHKLMSSGNSYSLDGPNDVSDVTLSQNVSEGIGTGSTYQNRSTYYGDIRSFGSYMPIEFSFKPGEVKVFAPKSDAADIFGSGGVRLKTGYDVSDDFGLSIHNPDKIDPAVINTWRFLHKVKGRSGDQLYLTDLVRFDFRADRFTKLYSNNITTDAGGGAYFAVGTPRYPIDLATFNNDDVPKAVSYFRSIMAMNPHIDWTKIYWPNDDLPELQYTVADLVPGGGNPKWTNLYTVSIGPRMTIGQGYGSSANRPTRGVLMNSPFLTNSLTLPVKEATHHPANNPVEMSYSTMSINSNLSPEVGTSGYIATGFQSGEGLSKIVMAEFPVTPVASLAELQGWDLRGGNPLPPLQYNVIGNSEATPLIQQDGILSDIAYTSDVKTNLQHDDSYCANHLLFDDWFLSTISGMPANLGSTTARDVSTVYRDFLTGKDRLLNRAYRPTKDDYNISATKADQRVNEIINSPRGDGFLKVASRIEVDGMFNVNSTSVKAWRALLGHARSQRVAYHTENGIIVDPNSYDHVVSRNPVASDVKAGSDPGAGAAFPHGSEYTGFRTMTDAQLDELAEKIVEQIRARGPFLSLSEFINRQLSRDDDLSIAGALQVALNSLTDDPNAALKDAAIQLSEETMDPADPKLDGAGYSYLKAAEGYSIHGFPGWIRQADILRPLAPIISVRDDTFTIRAYGDVTDDNGNILAQAWCEATVRRTRDFVNPGDEADTTLPPLVDENQIYGREYAIISFRWLNPDEV
jgi:type II secretory pathway pseudopilin PulG